VPKIKNGRKKKRKSRESRKGEVKKSPPSNVRREAIPKTDLSINLKNGSCESHTIQSPKSLQLIMRCVYRFTESNLKSFNLFQEKFFRFPKPTSSPGPDIPRKFPDGGGCGKLKA
jgi:hypothetical protein